MNNTCRSFFAAIAAAVVGVWGFGRKPTLQQTTVTVCQFWPKENPTAVLYVDQECMRVNSFLRVGDVIEISGVRSIAGGKSLNFVITQTL